MRAMQGDREDGLLFPRWANLARPVLAILLIGGPLYLIVLTAFGASPKTLNVGYKPKQPVPYSHALHVGQLGMDCRYCHTTVMDAAQAAIPPTQTCMNCHKTIRSTSAKLLPVFESYATGMPVEWVKVHDLPDYVYFNHSRHVRSGVGCETCHGRIDRMEEVEQVAPLSMGWCLSCHRSPDANLRPLDEVTTMGWVPPSDPALVGSRLREERNINPSTDCWTCHR